MKTEDRNVIRKISRHKDLEENLPIYGNSYINAVFEYNLIRLGLNYYTLKEVFDDGGSILADEALGKPLDEVHTIIYDSLLSGRSTDDQADIKAKQDNVERLRDIRDELTRQMRVLTAYTDAMQIYEYVLNRVEYGITGEKYDVDTDSLADRLFRYLFSENDKMVINSKISMVTAQLPIRMTKSRFFDYLNDTLNIYNGSDISSFDDFCEMIRSSALLELPDGYGKLYPEVFKMVEQLEKIDYKKLDEVTYKAVMEQFGFTTTHLTDIVSNHLLAMEIVNALLCILLALPYQRSEAVSVDTCIRMISYLHDAYISEGVIPDEVDECLENIEGVQEMLTEDIMQFESVLPDILEESKDEISWIMADKIFGNLSVIAKLMSDSLFIDIDDKTDVDSDKVTDSVYIEKKRDEMVTLFTDFFSCHTKEVNRAVMALVFSNMPVLFNSVTETKEYIEHSLDKCGNESELMACAKILDEMMADD